MKAKIWVLCTVLADENGPGAARFTGLPTTPYAAFKLLPVLLAITVPGAMPMCTESAMSISCFRAEWRAVDHNWSRA